MKKMIAILLVLCLALGGVVGYLGSPGFIAPESAAAMKAPEVPEVPESPEAPAEAEAPAAEEPAVTPAAPKTEEEALQEMMDNISLDTLDLDRLYATRQPDEIVLSVDGQDETWEDYFYFLASQVDYVEDYFVQLYAYYGMELYWSSLAEGDDTTYADMAVEGAVDAMRQFAAIEGFARENGIELTEENRETIAQQLESDMVTACGENATEAEFEKYLAEHYLSREMYDRINRVNVLYQETYRQLYGENGEMLDEETALRYLEDNGYISANHILLMTIDPTTGEPLDEAALVEKEDTARKLAEELQAITDPEERMARFAQLKEEYCEDTGKVVYPAGYTFTHRTMVTEFEDACNALEPYQVSDPVQSSYGYHIIVKLPPDADALIFDSSTNPITARATAANAEYGQRLQSYMDGIKAEYAEGFEIPNLLDYLNE